MAEQRPRIGKRVVAKVTKIKGHCGWGHKVGDTFDDVSIHNCGGICGIYYHDLFPWIMMLQFNGSMGGEYPDSFRLECTDRVNAVQMEIRRVND